MSSRPESVGPVQHALSTEVPLLRIFQHLSVNDLLSCRLVNQKWTVIAGIILKSRSTFIVHEKLDQPLNNTQEEDYNVEEALWTNLEFLSSRLRTNPNFPFLGFTISNPLKWAEYEILQDFARSNGHYFKRLTLDDVKIRTVILALGQWFQNIEELILGDVDREAKEDFGEETARAWIDLKKQGIRLPYLRRLTLPPYGDQILGLGRELGESVLEVAPKIAAIENFHPTVTDAVINHGKVAALSNLVIREGYSEHTEKLQRLAQSGLKLTSLVLDCSYFPEHDLAPCISDVLQSSRDSVERLDIHYFLQDPPTMPNLKLLCIADWVYDEEDGIGPLFETSNPINSYWPALETVRLELQNCFASSVRSYFKADDVFTTVKTLEILCEIDNEGLTSLAPLFPNVSCLRVDWAKCRSLTSALCDFWTIPLKIKELEIYNCSELSDIDAFLTGLPTRTCEKFRKMPKLPLDSTILDAIRINPSVVQLEGLENLTIFFTLEDGIAVPEGGDPPPAPVSEWYALGLMPNLRTRFLYDSRADHLLSSGLLGKLLEPYASFVSVEHRWTHEVRRRFE